MITSFLISMNAQMRKKFCRKRIGMKICDRSSHKSLFVIACSGPQLPLLKMRNSDFIKSKFCPTLYSNKQHAGALDKFTLNFVSLAASTEFAEDLPTLSLQPIEVIYCYAWVI